MSEETFGFEDEDGFEDQVDSDVDDADGEGALDQSTEEPQFDYLVPSRVSKSGWIKKKGGGKEEGSRHQGSFFARRNWKKRWFELRDTIFKYYKTDQTHKGKALGWINLSGLCTVKSVGGSSFTLITPKRSFEFEASNNTDAGDWVAALTNAINTAELDSL
eukprot:m.89990 g.89990  ORF g.89990 m.89990 type:complete len:161 (-) comp8844_c0_seq1:1768-2250(-)